MNQSKLIVEIGTVLPELQPELSRDASGRNPLVLLRIITRYTGKMAAQHNELMTSKCIKLIGTVYTKGDQVLKNAVTDVFIFSLDAILLPCGFNERKKLVAVLPQNLRNVYLKQVYSSCS